LKINYAIKSSIVANLFLFLVLLSFVSHSQDKNSVPFKIIAFYSAKNDLAHIDFVKEAHQWFRATG